MNLKVSTYLMEEDSDLISGPDFLTVTLYFAVYGQRVTFDDILAVRNHVPYACDCCSGHALKLSGSS